MTNGWNLLCSAMFFLTCPGTLFAALQQEEPRYMTDEMVRLMEEHAKNPPKPLKQLSDSELATVMNEAEMEIKLSLILGFEHAKEFIDKLSLVDGQIEQIKEKRTDLKAKVQELENAVQEKQAATTDPAILDKFVRESLDKLREDVEECLTDIKQEVFLPHQRDIFDAILKQHVLLGVYRQVARRARWVRVLGNYLKLTSREMAELKEAVEKASKDLSEIKKTARKKAVKQAVAVLPEKKRPPVEDHACDDIEILARLLKIAKN